MTVVHISDEIVHLAGVGIVHSPTIKHARKIKGYYLRILLLPHFAVATHAHRTKNPFLKVYIK